MTGDDLAREVQARCDARVAEAVAAERQRIAEGLRALLADPVALRRWLAAHGLADASPGATLAAWLRDLRGLCSVCRGPVEFVGDPVSSDATCSQTKRPVTGRDDQL